MHGSVVRRGSCSVEARASATKSVTLRITLLASFLGGCGDEFPIAQPLGDASVETIIDEDTATDIAPEASQLFGTCAADKDCAGDNAVCITTFPGGLCTHRCDGTAECSIAGRAGKCIANVCLPACGNGATCTAYNGGCLQRVSDIPVASGNYCAPACYGADRAPDGSVKCIPGTVCEEHTNRCVPVKGTMGAANGAACRDGEQCLGGNCLLASEGYPAGYCRSLGVLPGATAFVPGAPLPPSTCPPGSVVTPMQGSGVRTESFTWCWKSCSTTADCRAGYLCRFVNKSSTGYCGPEDCRIDVACPANHTCSGDQCTK